MLKKIKTLCKLCGATLAGKNTESTLDLVQ